MTFVPWLFLSFAWFVSFARALDVSGNVVWNDDCPGIESLRSSKAILDNGRLKGSITRDGGFIIPNVAPGTYILSVISPSYTFDQLRIDVQDNVVEVRPYTSATPLDPPSPILLSYPIALTPRQKHVFFVPRESFNVVGMLNNPMMLMMIAGAGMMLAMPYLMKNMDPESLEEFKAQHAKVQSVMSGGSGFSGLLAEEPAGNKPTTPAPTPAKSRGNKNKKHH